MIPSTVAEFRERHRAAEIGPRYSGWGHFTFTTVVSLSIIIAAALSVHAPTWREWLTVPLTFLFANFGEYWGHRKTMHVRRRLVGLVYQRHTVQHHQFFTHEAMSYATPRDFQMVLFPPLMIVYFFGAFALPVGLGLAAITTRNVALLYVATVVSYFLTYEWLHFAYHFDERSVLGRLGVVRVLRRHHQTHHNQALMGRYNFNITFPICDRLFGTTYPE